MAELSAFRALILQTVRTEVTRELTPYRAVVTGLSAGKVQFRPIEATTGGTQLYARLRGFALTVGDVVLVLGKQNPIVLEKVQTSAPASYPLDAPLAVTGADTGLKLPPGMVAGNITDVTALMTDQPGARYLGQAPRDITSIALVFNVTTAVAGTVTWAEVGIGTSPAPVLNDGGSLNISRVGFTNVAATFNSTGAKKVTVSTSTIAAGSHVWALYGSQATTPFQVTASLADVVNAGFVRFLAAGRISTMAVPAAFGVTYLASRAAWVGYQW